MKVVIKNQFNLKDEEITDITVKAKALIMNSNQEILLASTNNEYHFPGGGKEPQESIQDTIIREVLEETGIDVSSMELDPFAQLVMYIKDHPTKDRNKKVVIYYFEILTNDESDKEKMKLTKNELSKKFKLHKVKFNELKKFLIDHAIKYGDKKGITQEMLQIIDIFKEEN